MDKLYSSLASLDAPNTQNWIAPPMPENFQSEYPLREYPVLRPSPVQAQQPQKQQDSPYNDWWDAKRLHRYLNRRTTATMDSKDKRKIEWLLNNDPDLPKKVLETYRKYKQEIPPEVKQFIAESGISLEEPKPKPAPLPAYRVNPVRTAWANSRMNPESNIPVSEEEIARSGGRLRGGYRVPGSDIVYYETGTGPAPKPYEVLNPQTGQYVPSWYTSWEEHQRAEGAAPGITAAAAAKPMPKVAEPIDPNRLNMSPELQQQYNEYRKGNQAAAAQRRAQGIPDLPYGQGGSFSVEGQPQMTRNFSQEAASTILSNQKITAAAKKHIEAGGTPEQFVRAISDGYGGLPKETEAALVAGLKPMQKNVVPKVAAIGTKAGAREGEYYKNSYARTEQTLKDLEKQGTGKRMGTGEYAGNLSKQYPSTESPGKNFWPRFGIGLLEQGIGAAQGIKGPLPVPVPDAKLINDINSNRDFVPAIWEFAKRKGQEPWEALRGLWQFASQEVPGLSKYFRKNKGLIEKQIVENPEQSAKDLITVLSLVVGAKGMKGAKGILTEKLAGLPGKAPSKYPNANLLQYPDFKGLRSSRLPEPKVEPRIETGDVFPRTSRETIPFNPETAEKFKGFSGTGKTFQQLLDEQRLNPKIPKKVPPTPQEIKINKMLDDMLRLLELEKKAKEVTKKAGR